VYGIGYQQGIMDYSRDSDKMESNLLDTTLASVGCTSQEDKDNVLVAYEGQWRNLLSNFRRLHHVQDELYDEEHRRMVMMHNASAVGEKIVKVAQSYVKGKLREAVTNVTSQLPPEMLDNEQILYEVLEHDEQVDLWTRAKKHMSGPWRFVLIPSEVPNAFVSEILPHRIFITTAMFQQFVANQDELALVLGHEISHLILGHSTARNSLETSIRTIEILLLSLDPTEGILSIAFMSVLASIRSAVGMFYSRDNERQADELGIKLTAMACFDTKAASNVFYKMHLQNVESGRESSSNKVGWGGLSSFFDSHPPTNERYQTLLEDSGTENKAKYEDTTCSTLKTTFLDAIKPSEEGEASV